MLLQTRNTIVIKTIINNINVSYTRANKASEGWTPDPPLGA